MLLRAHAGPAYAFRSRFLVSSHAEVALIDPTRHTTVDGTRCGGVSRSLDRYRLLALWMRLTRSNTNTPV
eukprot:scaffold1383_cov360-Prasinococcus_capsulatus_cf.AAC.11